MPRPKITLTEQNKEDLASDLADKTNLGIQYKGNWDQLHDQYWKYYLAKPESKVKTWPWPGACPFLSPMITVAVDTLNSLYYDAMLSGRPQLIATDRLNDEEAELADDFFFEFVWKKIISLERLGDAWNFETLIDGTSVVSYRWNRDKTVIRSTDVTATTKTKKTTRVVNGIEVELDEIVGFDTETKEIVKVKSAERPIIEVMDMARLFVAPGTKRSLDMEGSLQHPSCPWYFIESYKTKEQARQMREDGYEGLEEDDIEALLGEVELTERERTQSEKEEVGQIDTRKVFFRVFFMRRVLPGKVTHPDGEEKTQSFDDPKGVAEEIIVWYLPKTKEISMVMPLSRMYPDNMRPHIDNHHTTVGNFFFSMGVPAQLENVARLDTSATRQLVDHGTLVNKPFGFYEPARTGLLPSLQTIAPGSLIAVENASGVKMASMTSNHDFWNLIRIIAQEWQERLTAVTDFVGGRNTSLPNSPRTARGQSMMLGQANIAFAHRVALRVIAYRTLFRRIGMLYQNNAPEEMEFETLNRATNNVDSRSMPRRLLSEVKDFTFRLNPNRMQESEGAQQRLSLVMNMVFLAQDPEALRNAMSDVYSAQGKLDDFNNRIWPEEKLEVQKQQLQQQQQQQEAPAAPEVPEASQELQDVPVQAEEPESLEDLAVNI